MNYEYEIPIFGFPDSTAIAKEHKILSNISCPMCNKKSLIKIKQYILMPEKDSDRIYSILGDRFECMCENCGHKIEVTFKFKISEK